MLNSRTRSVAVVLALATAFAVTACGDDDDDSGDAESGATVKIMSWGILESPTNAQPEAKAAAEAKVEAINEGGGINGATLELEYCDGKLDPNAEGACARRAVEGGFAAVVGSTAAFPNTWPLLERGGVPYLGGSGVTPAELASPVSFPLAGATPGAFRGAARQVLESGAKRPAIVETPLGASQFASAQVATALRAGGVEPIRTVSAPVAGPDQAATAAQAAEGSDAVIITAVPADALKVVQSLRQANYSGRIASISAIFPDDSLEALGSGADGMLLTSQLTPVSNTENEGVERFIEEMDRYAPDAAKDEVSLRTWAAIELFAELAEDIDGDVTAASVLEAMKNLSDPIELEVTGPYAVAGRTAPDAAFPQLFNPTVVANEVRGGQVVQTSDGFVDPFRPAGG